MSVLKKVGGNAEKYEMGQGLYLKAGYPINDGDDVVLEAGLYLFSEKKKNYSAGVVVVPATLGYRYTFNRKATGFYVEPQAGYNFVGNNTYYVNGYSQSVDFNGLCWGLVQGMCSVFPSSVLS